MKLFADVTYNELKRWLEEHDEPSYRADQIFEWAYQHVVGSFEEMSNLPKDLRAMPEGVEVKCVSMRMDGCTSACLSSQVGCAVGCDFCASTIGGCERSLSAGAERVLEVTQRSGHYLLTMNLWDPQELHTDAHHR